MSTCTKEQPDNRHSNIPEHIKNHQETYYNNYQKNVNALKVTVERDMDVYQYVISELLLIFYVINSLILAQS